MQDLPGGRKILGDRAGKDHISLSSHKATASDGAAIAWREDGQGEPLLLISGQATGMNGWDTAVGGLARSFRIIRFDHRGTGASTEGTPDSYTTRGFAADAQAVLDAAGVTRAHVYGHSMGGRVAQWFALDYPARVASLILVSTSAGDGRGTPRSAPATASLTSGDQSRLTPLFFNPGWAQAHPEAVNQFFRIQASQRTKSLHFRASRSHDTWNLVPAITAPTLIIHGTEDALTPVDNAVMLAHQLPCAHLIQVAGAHHGLHLDHPDIRTWIEDFLAANVP
jgi:pimeloyl-ACP methyl ester carboxylesterase